MPAPRIFISSTCYDLQEIRGNIRQFIKEFGYEPIMSEFGDIFYNFDKNAQDSAIDTIKASDYYLLIIGDYFGTHYHKEKNNVKTPSNVTMKEFENALNLDKPKIIFINKFVEYDYQNYKIFLNKKYSEKFNEMDKSALTDEIIKIEKEKIKSDFDDIYPFPKEQYRYIFYFLDKIYELKTGNAYHKFETSFEIKDILKKQWASFFQECLSKRKEISEKEEIVKISKKIDSIYSILESLGKGLKDSNIDELQINIDFKSLEKTKDELYAAINELCYNTEYGDCQRFLLNKKLTPKELKVILDRFPNLIQDYKWSKFIKLENIFHNVDLEIFPFYEDISYEIIFKINNIYSSVLEDEKESLVSMMLEIINKLYIENATKTSSYSNSSFDEDEFPF